MDRQRAAVAADLVLLWRRLQSAVTGEGADEKDVGAAFNCPSAGYAEDVALIEQLRWV